MLQFDLWKRLLIAAVCAVGLFLALPNAFYDRVERHNDAAKEIDALGETPERAAALAGWPGFMPSGLVNLGLDLRGGAHLLVEVKVEEAYAKRLSSLWPEVRDALRAERAQVGGVRRQEAPDGELRVRIEHSEAMDAALKAVRALSRPVATVAAAGARDLEVSGQGNILTVRLSEAEKAASDERTVGQSLEVIRRRVDGAGTREPTIQRQGATRILVQVPGLGTAEELKILLGSTAQLTFHPVISRTSNPEGNGGVGSITLPSMDEPDIYYVLDASPVVTGDELVDARSDFDQNGRPAVGFRFNTAGARAFGDYTRENIGNLFAIVLDSEVVSAPEIISHIPGGSGIITGQFTTEDTYNMAIMLRSGALPVGVEFLEERTIGPELGEDSINAGRTACLVAFALVLVFMALSYGMFGIFANIALIVNVGLIFGALSVFGATLTLPGIAGIVLTIGMAVDANVLIFERIREELAGGKGPARAMELGYQKALSAIVDANITTLITAGILWAMGAGPVRGFAVTLGVGIFTSVFTAYFVTRLLVVLWFERARPKTLEV